MKRLHLKIILSLLLLVLLVLHCGCFPALPLSKMMLNNLFIVVLTLWGVLFILDMGAKEREKEKLVVIGELLEFYLLHYKKAALALFAIERKSEIVESFQIPRFQSMTKLYDPSMQNGKLVAFEDLFAAQNRVLQELKMMLYSHAFLGDPKLQQNIIQYVTRIEDLQLERLVSKMRKEYETLTQPILEALAKEEENPKTLYKENNLLHTPSKLYFSIVCFKDFHDKILSVK